MGHDAIFKNSLEQSKAVNDGEDKFAMDIINKQKKMLSGRSQKKNSIFGMDEYKDGS